MKFNINISFAAKNIPNATENPNDYEYKLEAKFDDESAKIVAELFSEIDFKITKILVLDNREAKSE